MGIFIGGDTQQLNYDFGLKVANSVAECPMKLYKGAIDVNNPPSPFTYPSIISDFSGKVSGSTTENPNIAKRSITLSTLATPSDASFAELNQTNIDLIKTLDASSCSSSVSTNGIISQQLFSFNLIEIFQRQYGTIPNTTDTASKVAWLKNSGIKDITCNYYGYGSCPSGNKIYLQVFQTDTNTWSTSSTTNNTSNTSTLITFAFTAIINKIDNNGFIHYLAYSDSSNGTIPSVVNTDYISLTINYKDQSSVVWWQEVTSQTTLDKLKAQNEIPITSVDYANRTAVWNNKNLVLQSDTQPAVRDDFAGKILGSVVENPHISKRGEGTSLIVPNGFWMGEYDSTSNYTGLQSLDGTNFNKSTTGVNCYPQMLFSFNIIEMLERKYGSLPCENNLSAKIAYAKANISKIVANWYGYGVSPLGNKAYLKINSGSDWVGGETWSWINNSNSVQKINAGLSSYIDSKIDSNGFVHFLAYTDSARTTDSTLLVLNNHGLSQWDIVENTTRGTSCQISAITANTCVTSSITGQTAGDTINKYHTSRNGIAGVGTTTTNIYYPSHGLSTGDYIVNNGKGLSKITVVDSNNLTCSSPVPNQAQGDVIYLYRLTGTQTAEGQTNSTFLGLNNHGLIVGDYIENVTLGQSRMVQSIRTDSITTNVITGQASGNVINKYRYIIEKTAESGTDTTTIKITNHGLSTGDIIANTNRAWFSTKITVVDANTITCNTPITGQTNGDTIRLAKYIGTQQSNDIVIPSTIYTDYISLDIQLKPTQGYDLLVPTNPRRDSVSNGNYDNCILAEKVYNSVVSDFTGKISGDLNSNPNVYKRTTQQAQSTNADVLKNLLTPTQFMNNINSIIKPETSEVQPEYDNMKTINALSASAVENVNGYIPQQLFQFDLIKIFEKQYGTINATTLQGKIDWLKSNMSSLSLSWYGYGSTVGGNKAYLDYWSASNNYWTFKNSGIQESYANSSTAPTPISIGTSAIDNKIDSNGFFNVIAYSLASDGITPSTIYTDYIKLTITFSNGNNGIEYFTNNSVEIATQIANKATSYLCEVDLTPVASALYGGSNSALKSALKAIQVDIWASGYGANGNDVSNGVKARYYDVASIYGSLEGVSQVTLTNNNISKGTAILDVYNCGSKVQTTNKIYILVTSLYNSSVDIPSVVNLDYLNIRVDLARVPDVISNPPQITLTDTFSLLVRGFSPAWDDTNTKNYNEILCSDSGILQMWRNSNKEWFLRIPNSNSSADISINETNLKYQTINFLMQTDGINKTLYMLKNNGIMKKVSNANTSISKNIQLLLMYYKDGTHQADAFLDSIVYMPNQTFDDTQAEAILRGQKEGFEFPELFDINQVTLHANATRANGVITLNATAAWQGNNLYIPVLPNNQYTINVGTNTGWVSIHEYYNNILIKIDTVVYDATTGVKTFTTSSKTNKILVGLTNKATGTYTFSQISLKTLM